MYPEDPEYFRAAAQGTWQQPSVRHMPPGPALKGAPPPPPPPPGDFIARPAENRSPRPPEAFISSLLLGQATAVLACTVGVIYGAGELALGLKIWYAEGPWGPVLSGVPRNLVLVNAIDDLIPAFVVAVPFYCVYRKFHKAHERRHYRFFRQALITLIAAAVATLVTLAFLWYTARYFGSEINRPKWQIITASFAISAVMIGVVLAGLSLFDKHMRSVLVRQLIGTAMVAVALAPCVASAYAAFPLPTVYLCGPTFFTGTENITQHYVEGSLIGDSGQWAYILQAITNDQDQVQTSLVSMVPLSAVKDEVIFLHGAANCSDLAKP